jgi:hypothetical protein
METLTINYAKPFSLELIRGAISQDWSVEASHANTLVVHGDGSRAYLHPDETLNASGRWYCLLVDYSDVELAKNLIERIADAPDVIVDNDFGTVLPGDQFVARIRAERKWNWHS